MTTIKTTQAKPKNTIIATGKGIAFSLLLLVNTLVHCSVLFVFAISRLLLPGLQNKIWLTKIMNAIATSWVGTNSACITILHKPQWRSSGLERLRLDQWYLITANHQSWADILILQRAFHGRVPMLKFFLKQQLIWVPVIGLAWWALDFPFMKRYSREFLNKNPHLKGKDLQATQQACEKFKYTPTTILNFAEGTRFSADKHKAQQSPFNHLLKPKAGGLAFALSAMQGRIDTVLDVTVFYPQGAPSFWQFLCNGAPQLIIESKEVPADKISGYQDYDQDPAAKRQFQQNVSTLWQEKDQRIEELAS